MKTTLFRVLLAASAALSSAIEVGDSIPSVDMHYGFPPDYINLADRFAGKKAILVGLPGAFTPT